jgi:GGDEF domain-containing protein
LATSETARPRRFALPDLADRRAEEYIEAFLDGPNIRRHRPSPKRRRRPMPAPAGGPGSGTAPAPAVAMAQATVVDGHTLVSAPRTSDLRTLPGRVDFNAALERESLRAARYNRPAAVAIVELKADRPGQAVDPWVRTLTGPIVRALRGGSRSTDLVARVASTRFQVLLPETAEAGASRFAERVTSACHASIESLGAPLSIRVSVAVASPDSPLTEALAHALRSIEAA